MIDSVSAATRAFERAPDPAFGSPSERHDDGWLGQVPPPTPTAPTGAGAEPSPYAVPQLAPEPWKADPPLPGTDPTLFG